MSADHEAAGRRPAWMSPKVYVGVAAVLLSVDAVVWLAGWLDSEQVESFKFDLFKLVFNLAVLTIGGGLIKQALDERKALESFRVEVTQALGEIHATVYVVRRQLRMDSSNPKRVHDCLVELMKARAALGSIGHHLRTNREIGQKAVVANIKIVRAYLEEIIEETIDAWEPGADSFVPGPKLEGFLAPEPTAQAEAEAPGPSDYRQRFKAPYLRAKIAADPSWDMTEEQEQTAALPPP